MDSEQQTVCIGDKFFYIDAQDIQDEERYVIDSINYLISYRCWVSESRSKGNKYSEQWTVVSEHGVVKKPILIPIPTPTPTKEMRTKLLYQLICNALESHFISNY